MFVPFPAAPVFTLENIMAALKGFESDWNDIGLYAYVPWDTLRQIEKQHSTDSARLREILHYILSLHPYPGWRVIIWALHCIGQQVSAARIQEYAEPVTGMTYTT